MSFPREPCAERLRQGLAAMGLGLDEMAQAALLDYLELMARWNRAYNLTAIRDPLEMVDKHLLDSLSLRTFVADAPLLDVGAGAGLPGLVLAIVTPPSPLAGEGPGERGRRLGESTAVTNDASPSPHALKESGAGGEGERNPHAVHQPVLPSPIEGQGVFSVTLVDAVAKKVRFMQHAIRCLGLNHAQAVHARIESLDGQYPQITSRAFASLADFLSLTRHLLAPGGRWLAMKGQMPHDELDTLPNWAEVVGTPRLIAPQGLGERHLIILRDKETP